MHRGYAFSLASLLGLSTLLLGAAQGHAALLTYTLSGTIEDISNGDGSFTTLGGLTVGHSFTYEFVVSDTAPDANADPATGEFAGTTTKFSSDGLTFQAFATAIKVQNGLPDQITVTSTIWALPPGWVGAATGVLSLGDGSGTALSTDKLPAPPIALDSFAKGKRKFTLSGLAALNGTDPPTTGVTVLGTFDVQAVAAPEPSTLCLLGLGVAGLTGYAWRKRKQKAA